MFPSTHSSPPSPHPFPGTGYRHPLPRSSTCTISEGTDVLLDSAVATFIFRIGSHHLETRNHNAYITSGICSDPKANCGCFPPPRVPAPPTPPPSSVLPFTRCPPSLFVSPRAFMTVPHPPGLARGHPPPRFSAFWAPDNGHSCRLPRFSSIHPRKNDPTQCAFFLSSWPF